MGIISKESALNFAALVHPTLPITILSIQKQRNRNVANHALLKYDWSTHL